MSLGLMRIAFFALNIIIVTGATISWGGNEHLLMKALLGVLGGGGLSFLLISLDSIFRRFKIKNLNIVTLGLFFGYLLGLAATLVINSALTMTMLPITPEVLGAIKIVVFLSATYLGAVITIYSADELQLCIPFIKLKSETYEKKDIIFDSSVLTDPRTIDIASSGILDQRLIIPKFIIKELRELSETGDEHEKAKARRCLEIAHKLEELPHLDLRYDFTDFPEIKNSAEKITKLARLINANIITSDFNKVESSSYEGVRIINIHSLANALKPLMQSGEFINIKVQRYGKEAHQGVGYLDDGTMVVINGGGDYIGETIKTQVLSVKHTSSGRMVFCNAMEEEQTLTPSLS
ncbi:MAG: PIN/TRAM domain-containing protein [Chlamydiota bacterium]